MGRMPTSEPPTDLILVCPSMLVPLAVLWKDGDVFAGEDDPPAIVHWPWPHDSAFTTDAFGEIQSADVDAGHVRLDVSVTPIFLSPRA